MLKKSKRQNKNDFQKDKKNQNKIYKCTKNRIK